MADVDGRAPHATSAAEIARGLDLSRTRRGYIGRCPSYRYEGAFTVRDRDGVTLVHDPSGVDIPRKIEEGLRERAGDDVFIESTHAAVTPEQIERWDLPTRPTKAGDSRAKRSEGESVELGAIPAHLLRGLAEDCIGRHVDPEALATLMAAKESERELLWRRAERVGGRP